MDYEFIFNEIMAHPALCVHPEPKKVLILGDGLFELENEIKKHSNVEIVKCESLDSVKDSDYNIIYTDDEQEVEDRNTLHTLLTDDGICVFHGDTWDSENFNEDLKSFDKFRFVIPFEGEFIFASKKWHPTADVSTAFLPLPDNYHIVEIQVPKRIIKKSIGELEFESKYQLELIAIRRKYEEFSSGRKTVVEHLIRRPGKDIILDASDALVVLGMTEDTDRFVEVNA